MLALCSPYSPHSIQQQQSQQQRGPSPQDRNSSLPSPNSRESTRNDHINPVAAAAAVAFSRGVTDAVSGASTPTSSGGLYAGSSAHSADGTPQSSTCKRKRTEAEVREGGQPGGRNGSTSTQHGQGAVSPRYRTPRQTSRQATSPGSHSASPDGSVGPSGADVMEADGEGADDFRTSTGHGKSNGGGNGDHNGITDPQGRHVRSDSGTLAAVSPGTPGGATPHAETAAAHSPTTVGPPMKGEMGVSSGMESSDKSTIAAADESALERDSSAESGSRVRRVSEEEIERRRLMCSEAGKMSLCKYPGCTTRPSFGDSGDAKASFCGAHKVGDRVESELPALVRGTC